MRVLSGTRGLAAIERRAPGTRWATTRWPWALVAGGWGVALLAALTPQRVLLNHHYLLRQSHLPWLAAVALFLVGWQVMIAAMMLPASMSVVALLAAHVSHLPRQGGRLHRVLLAFLAGYTLIWTGYAVVLFAGDTLVHSEVDHWPWLAAHTWLLGAASFALAGGRELEMAARGHRRVSDQVMVGYFMAHERPVVVGGWGLGLFLGASSVGRCWALMLLLFGVGLGGLEWMVVLAAVMALEAWMPRGRRWLGLVLGAVLLLLAGAWLAHPLWLVSGASV